MPCCESLIPSVVWVFVYSSLSTHRCSADKREIYKNFAQHDDSLSMIEVDDNVATKLLSGMRRDMCAHIYRADFEIKACRRSMPKNCPS